MKHILRRPQSKAPTFVYGGLAATILLVVMAVAFIVVPPAPPSIAEFTPMADDQIIEAPSNQQSRFGTGEGEECAAGQVCEDVGGGGGRDSQDVTTSTNTAKRRIIDKARVRRCVGDPPRQTEDPQSPPCVNFWEGDNGGATTKGVTGNEIRVVLGCMEWCWMEDFEAQIPPVVAHFNSRYELYGRKFKVFVEDTGVTSVNHYDPVAQRAAAEKLEERYRPFAVLHPSVYADDPLPYFDVFIRNKTIVAQSGSTYITAAHMRERAPWMWSYDPPLDHLEAHLAEVACKSLADRPGSSPISPSRRKFALVYQALRGRTPVVAPFVDGIARCDGGPVAVRAVDRADDRKIQPVMAELAGTGVTSIVCICTSGGIGVVMRSASAVSYYPEWLLPGLPTQEEEAFLGVFAPPDQRIRTFGLASGNKLVRFVDEPWYWAVREAGPDAATTNTYEFQKRVYHELLILASGIQAAGPHLTPDTFARALRSLRFANPGAGQAPYWQATVGFGVNDPVMVDDVGLMWWDDAAGNEGRDTRTAGGWCYIDRGARWRLGAWPLRTMPLFDRTKPCR